MAGRMSPGWSLRKTLDKMLLVIINIKGNKRFPNFFSSHRIMFVSLWAAQSINYFLWAFLWLILSPLSTQVVSSRTLRRKNCTSCRACVPCYLEKKVQQSWQTSALGMHLPLARLVSTSVIFCLLPSSNIHRESKKNMPPNFSLYLNQISTDFKSSFTDILCGKFAVRQLLNIPPHLNCVATLPCEI